MAHQRMQPYRRCPVSHLIIREHAAAGGIKKHSICDSDRAILLPADDERLYIQSRLCSHGCITHDREFGPLEALPDNYEKLVLSTDTLLRINRGGIRQKNIMDFLLES